MTGIPTPARRTADRAPAAVLVGFMGAGKSTVGRILADRLGVDFIDTDVEIVRRTGRSVADIIAEDGLPGFRTIEGNVVVDVLSSHGGIVSLGGGAVTTQAVRQALTGHRVVYLKITAEAGFERVSGTDRPLLEVADPRARYAELLADRLDHYAACATIEIDAGGDDPELVADAVITELARELIPGRPT